MVVSTTEIDGLLADYVRWLRSRLHAKAAGDWVEITTPFLDRHNDHLQIYVRRQGDGYLLTDAGETISDLRMSGCDLDSDRRQDILRTTLNGFGVRMEDESLVVNASQGDFPTRKHSLVQAMLAINDLYYLSRASIVDLFSEDVRAWLSEHAIRFVARLKLTGTTGYDYLFDFTIPQSARQPERVIKCLGTPSRTSALNLNFAWLDTKSTRPPDAVAYAILNDTDQTVSPRVLDALTPYGIRSVLWSKREEFVAELAA